MSAEPSFKIKFKMTTVMKIDVKVSTIAAICSRAVAMASASGGYNDETAGQLLQSKEDVEQVPF